MDYAAAAKRHEIEPGRMHVHTTGRDQPRFIINFPTKRHWRSPSRLSDVAAGLDDLVATICRLGITSIAVPPLGCGLGGLPWADVHPLIVQSLGELDVDVLLWAPG